MMKTKTLAFISILGMVGIFASCSASSDELVKPESVSEGKGTFKLNLTANADFSEQTRALSEADYRNTDNFTVQLFKSGDSTPILTCKGSELNDKIEESFPENLEIGNYSIKAFYGEEYDASRDKFLVEGKKTFDIKKDDETQIELTCEPTCGKVSVNFDDSMVNYYDSYSISFSGTTQLTANNREFSWNKDDTAPWYIALDPDGETLNEVKQGELKKIFAYKVSEDMQKFLDGTSEKMLTATGSFRLIRNHGYKINVKPEYLPSEEGLLNVMITIDESTDDQKITYTVPVSWIYE